MADYTYTFNPKEGSIIGDSNWSDIVIAFNIPSGIVVPTRSYALSAISLKSTITGNNIWSSRDYSYETNNEGYATKLIFTHVDAKDESSFGECEFELKGGGFTTPDGDKPFGTMSVKYYYHAAPTFTLPLTDLDGYVTGSAYVTPAEGSGDGVVSVTADEGNEGLDRSGVVTFSTTKGEPTISVARTIVQEGLREPFAGSDGDFIVADGGTHHVLK